MISKVCVLVCAGVFVLCISMVSAEPVKCFQCNSANDPQCADLTSADTNSSYYRECDTSLRRSNGKAPFCRKVKLTILGEQKTVRILRECGYEIYKTNTSRCYEVDTDFKYEVICQCFSDSCNAAPQTISRSYFLVFLVLAAALGNRRAN